jgi:formylglycine-generating enzyme required for sulfatase activity
MWRMLQTLTISSLFAINAVCDGGEFADSIGIVMVEIPAGSFTMGSPANEKGRNINEEQYNVEFSQPFYVSKTEVTQTQWQEVMGDNPSHYIGENRPVDEVSWYDCIRFCNLLSQQDDLEPVYTIRGTDVTWNRSKRGYRLPTEAEWEYACRAGTTTRFHSGNTESDLNCVGWYFSNSSGVTHPVSKKMPNNWGLYDMHGNVREWCWENWHGEYPNDRVARGGAFGSSLKYCRSANRASGNPEWGLNIEGLRLSQDKE